MSPSLSRENLAHEKKSILYICKSFLQTLLLSYNIFPAYMGIVLAIFSSRDLQKKFNPHLHCLLIPNFPHTFPVIIRLLSCKLPKIFIFLASLNFNAMITLPGGACLLKCHFPFLSTFPTAVGQINKPARRTFRLLLRAIFW